MEWKFGGRPLRIKGCGCGLPQGSGGNLFRSLLLSFGVLLTLSTTYRCKFMKHFFPQKELSKCRRAQISFVSAFLVALIARNRIPGSRSEMDSFDIFRTAGLCLSGGVALMVSAFTLFFLTSGYKDFWVRTFPVLLSSLPAN